MGGGDHGSLGTELANCQMPFVLVSARNPKARRKHQTDTIYFHGGAASSPQPEFFSKERNTVVCFCVTRLRRDKDQSG